MRLIIPYAGVLAYETHILAKAAERVERVRYRHEPPVSRVGAKTRFVRGVLRSWGLSRAKWTDVHTNDLDPVCHLFALLLASRELRDEVARRVWAMVPCPTCNPDAVAAALEGTLQPTPDSLTGGACCGGTGVRDARQLWEEVRKAEVPGEVVEALARGLFLQARSLSSLPVGLSGNEWATNGFQPEIRDRGDYEKRPGRNAFLLRPDLAHRITQLPSGLATLADVTARALFLQSRSFQLLPVSIEGGAWTKGGYKPEVDGYERKPTSNPGGEDSPRWTVAERVSQLPAGRWVDAPSGIHLHITRQDATLCLPDGDLSDAVAILDPPYLGDGKRKITGYACESSREDVLSIARDADARGALVLIHEACGLARELGPGWIERPASPLAGKESGFHSKKSKARRSGKTEREFITANREPGWWPARQGELF